MRFMSDIGATPRGATPAGESLFVVEKRMLVCIIRESFASVNEVIVENNLCNCYRHALCAVNPGKHFAAVAFTYPSGDSEAISDWKMLTATFAGKVYFSQEAEAPRDRRRV